MNPPVLASLATYATAYDKETLNVQLDYSFRHEIALGGQLLTGVPTLRILDINGVLSTDLTVTNVAIDSTGKKINFTLTNVNGMPPNLYLLTASAQFTGSPTQTTLEGLSIEVSPPRGGQQIRCS